MYAHNIHNVYTLRRRTPPPKPFEGDGEKNLIIDVFTFSVKNENIVFLLLPVNVYRYQRLKDDRVLLYSFDVPAAVVIILLRFTTHTSSRSTTSSLRVIFSKYYYYRYYRSVITVNVPFMQLLSSIEDNILCKRV